MTKTKEFRVLDKIRNGFVEDAVGGYAAGGFALTWDGRLVMLGTLEWSYAEENRYSLRREGHNE